MIVVSLNTSLLAFAAIVVMLSATTSAAQQADYATKHDRAIELARAGDYDSAIRMLAELRARFPNAAPILHDETVVFGWAGADGRVILNADEVDIDTAPLYVHEAIAKSARNLGDFEMAQRWYRAALLREPSSIDVRAGLSMASGEAGAFEQAREYLQQASADQSHGPVLLLASAYLYELEDKPLDALTTYDAVLSNIPGDSTALDGKIRALRALGLPGKALEIAEAHPELLMPAAAGQLRADQLALQLREAISRARPDNEPYRHLDAAIRDYDATIANPKTLPPETIRQLRIDRMVAYFERHRSSDLLAEYRSLVASDPALPAYAHVTAARAYLAQREPENARTSLDAARQANPDEPAIDLVTFYLHLDLEKHAEALALAERILARTPKFNQVDESRVIRPNDQRVQAEVRVALAHVFSDETGVAQSQLESLSERAPNNTDVRHELANVYRWRGWPERAAQEYSQALTLNPKLLPAQVGIVNTQIDQQQYAYAKHAVGSLQDLHPGESSTSLLARRWEIHNRQQVLIDVSRSKSSGTVFGNDQYDVSGWWFTEPLRDSYRVFVHTFDSSGDFEFGNIDRRRAGIGVEYRRDVWTTTSEITMGRNDSSDSGLSARVKRRINDVWSIGGVIELNSETTPLRAYRDDIESDLAGINVSYLRNDWFGISGGLHAREFSDSNTKNSAYLDGYWRWITTPHYKLNITGDAYTSSASEIPTPYFNPATDRKLKVGLDNRWLQYRRYDHSILHRLHAQAGTYNQKGFGTDAIWSLDYEVIWALNDVLELRAGWQREKNFYDGQSELQTFYRIGLEGKF